MCFTVPLSWYNEALFIIETHIKVHMGIRGVALSMHFASYRVRLSKDTCRVKRKGAITNFGQRVGLKNSYYNSHF